jgi:hypothetical protein
LKDLRETSSILAMDPYDIWQLINIHMKPLKEKEKVYPMQHLGITLGE